MPQPSQHPALTRFEVVGRRGRVELARALGATIDDPDPARTGGPEARHHCASVLAAGTSARLLASPEFDERHLVLAGQDGGAPAGAGDIRLLHPLAPARDRRAPEPVPHDISPRELERLARSGSFALSGPAGTYKLTFELVWEPDFGGPRLFRVGDLSGRLFGWIGCGAALPGATFPLRVVKLDERPLVLRLERVDAATGEPRAWDPAGLHRAWAVWRGRSLWSFDTPADDTVAESTRLDESFVQTLRGGQIDLDLRWRFPLTAPSPTVTLATVEVTLALLSHKEAPPLRLGAPADCALRELPIGAGADELTAEDAATSPAPFRLLIETPTRRVLLTADRPVRLEAGESSWASQEGAGLVLPTGTTRLAFHALP